VRIGGAVLLVALLTLGAYVGYDRYSSTRTSFANLDYRVVSDTEVSVRFQVRMSPGDRVRCVLRARDRDNVSVGTRELLLGPDLSGTVTRSEVVTTTGRAVVGEVLTCRPA
jgi:hypothetical protein